MEEKDSKQSGGIKKTKQEGGNNVLNLTFTLTNSIKKTKQEGGS